MKIICFTCAVNKKTCSILKIPGIQAKDLQSCPDYRKDSTSKPPPPPKEKVTELKLF